MAAVTPLLAVPGDPSVERPAPSRRGRHEREHAPTVVGVALAVAIAAMPILVPSALGNTAPADLPIGVACVVTLLWLGRAHARMRAPYLLPVTVIMLAGLVATWFSGVPTAALTVLQDAFLLVWGICIANAVRLDPWLLRIVVTTWVRAGIGWAAVLCFGRLAGISWLAGMSASDGTRASLTFGDPNYAGNYFVACLAILLATAVLRHRVSRIVGAGVILLAIAFTGSNGAVIGVVVVLLIGLLGSLRRRVGLAAMLGVLTLGAAAAISLAPHVSVSDVQQRAADSVAILHDSLGRADESSGTREVLIREAYDLYRHGNLIGIGPARTQEVLQAKAAQYVKEAHDDYLAEIVERGVGGAVGLVLLIWVIGTRFSRVASHPQRPEVSAIVPRPEYLLGLVVAFAAAGFFYEVLHFRHLWALLGLGAGIDPAASRTGGQG